MTEQNPLDGFHVPGPPEELRERTLNAARTVAAMEAGPVAVGWLTSQPLWAAAVVALLLVHLALGSILGAQHPKRARNVDIAEQGDLLDLPRVDVEGIFEVIDGGNK